MTSYRTTKIIPIALALIAIAIAIAGLASLARVIFLPANGEPKISKADISKEALLSTDADHALVVTVRGPLVNDESFRSYKIKITATSREITTYSGYFDQQIDKISLSNNTKAYEQFVYSLYKANLIKGTELTGDRNDIRGTCATGKIYNFQVIAAEDIKGQLWTSTCPGSKGSLNANVDQLITLFTTQVPGSKTLIGKLW